MKAHRRIIVIAAAALVVAVLAAALVTSPWGDESHSGVASSDSATIPQPSLDRLGKLTRSIPADSRSPQPAELATLSAGAKDLFDALRSRSWNGAAGTAQRMNTALGAFQAGEVPQRIYTEVNNALDSVNRAVRARRARQGSLAALDAAQASLDLQLRYRPTVEVNVSRFDLWARQLQVDAAAGDSRAVSGDVATLGWIRDRIPLASSDGNRVDDLLRYLGAAAQAEQLTPAADAAARLSEAIAGLEPTT